MQHQQTSQPDARTSKWRHRSHKFKNAGMTRPPPWQHHREALAPAVLKNKGFFTSGNKHQTYLSKCSNRRAPWRFHHQDEGKYKPVSHQAQSTPNMTAGPSITELNMPSVSWKWRRPLENVESAGRWSNTWALLPGRNYWCSSTSPITPVSFQRYERPVLFSISLGTASWYSLKQIQWRRSGTALCRLDSRLFYSKKQKAKRQGVFDTSLADFIAMRIMTIPDTLARPSLLLWVLTEM